MTNYRILLLEDSLDDTELIKRNLIKQGVVFDLVLAINKEEFVKAIEFDRFDIILADYNLPRFNAMEAFGIIKKHNMDLPFIIVSGNIGEEQAVASMKAGVHDYVFKSNMARLGQVIKREYEESLNRKENRKNQQALIKSESKYRLLVENQNELLLSFDPDFRIKYANHKYCHTFGKNLDELIGNSFFSFIHKDDVERVKKSTEKVFLPPFLAVYEERANTINGYKWFRWSINAEVEDEKVVSIIAVGQEITEIVDVLEKLEKEKERFQSMFQGAGDGIVFADSKGRVQEINLAFKKITGLKDEEVIGKSAITLIKKLIEVKQIPSFLKLVQTALKGRDITVFELPYKRKVLEISTVQTVESKNHVGIIRDVSIRKTYEKKLAESEKSLRKLTEYLQDIREKERTSIAREIHDEVGQMLTAIKMDITFLKKQVHEDNILTELENIVKLTDRTIYEVKSIITKLRPGVLDDLGLSAAIDWLVSEHNSRTSDSCKLVVDINDDEIDQIIATNVFRVIQESLTNIVRHAKATKTIVLLVKKKDHLILNITDNGIGMPKNAIESSDSFGLMGMKERILSMHGKFEIKKAKTGGTLLDIVIPF